MSDDETEFEIRVDDPTDLAIDPEVEAELAEVFAPSTMSAASPAPAGSAPATPAIGAPTNVGRAAPRDTTDVTSDGTTDATTDSSTGGTSGTGVARSTRVGERWSEIRRRLRRPASESPTSPPVGRARLEPAPPTRAAERPGGRPRVVITDDVEKVRKVAGEQRFRERRLAVRRAEGRRRLWWTIVVGSVVLSIVVVLLLLTSPILSIRNVRVDGVVYADLERVGEVVASLKGDPILTADLHDAELELEAIPWVEAARVSMRLPSTVTVEIVERRPVAFYRAVDGFNRVIDIDGRVLDVIEGDPVDYPPIRGTGPNLSAGEFAEQPFLGVVQLMNGLPRDLRVRLVAAAVSPEGEIAFTLTDDVIVEFGRPDDFQEKLVALVNEIKRQGSRRYSVIDVSTGDPSVR